MSYPSGRVDRYRKAAEELTHLAKCVPSDFVRRYYQCTAERCLLVAGGEEAPLPKWATIAERNEPSAPPSGEVITSVPVQATPPLDEAIASVSPAMSPLPNEPILSEPQQRDTKPMTAHGRGAAHVVRELARLASRLASRAPN
jgi:hypothetical protein